MTEMLCPERWHQLGVRDGWSCSEVTGVGFPLYEVGCIMRGCTRVGFDDSDLALSFLDSLPPDKVLLLL